MDTLRIGFIGLGGICRQRHVPGLQRIEGIEFVAVANRSRESSEAAAGEFGIAHVHDRWEEVVARADIDAVFIGAWPYLHKPVSIAALEAGKHVFCQARMAMNLEEALAMRAAADTAGRVAMLCPVPFGLSVDRTVARLLREGAIGAPRFVSIQSFNGAWRDPATPMNWRKDERLSGLNMQTLGMYAEVMHRWFGPTQKVSARGLTYTRQRPDGAGVLREVHIPDQVLVNAEMDDGLGVHYAISGVVAAPRDTIDVYGGAGALHYDVQRDELLITRADGPAEPVEIRSGEAYDVRQWRVEEDFVNAVRHGVEYHPSFEDGVRYMQVVQAVHDSAASGRTVALEDV
jgi:predicted dehydrogenase